MEEKAKEEKAEVISCLYPQQMVVPLPPTPPYTDGTTYGKII
jgi:hypothetical protein